MVVRGMTPGASPWCRLTPPPVEPAAAFSEVSLFQGRFQGLTGAWGQRL